MLVQLVCMTQLLIEKDRSQTRSRFPRFQFLQKGRNIRLSNMVAQAASHLGSKLLGTLVHHMEATHEC